MAIRFQVFLVADGKKLEKLGEKRILLKNDLMRNPLVHDVRIPTNDRVTIVFEEGIERSPERIALGEVIAEIEKKILDSVEFSPTPIATNQ